MNTDNYIPILTESKDASVFADELNAYFGEVRKLPFGLFVVMINRMREMNNEEISDEDKNLDEKVFYFMMPCFMCQEKHQMNFTKEDAEKFEFLFQSIKRSIAMLDAYLKGLVSVEMIDGEWEFTLDEEQLRDVEKYIKKRGETE